jgi:hypothetical protein
MSTALDLIKEAMEVVGVLGVNETPNSWQADRGLKTLNQMIELESIDRTMIFTVEQNTFPAVSGQAVYTIGVGGDLNIARPPIIDNLFIRINSVDFPLKSINNQDYDGIPNKASGAFPQYFYYDAAFPLANLYVYGAPTQGDFYADTWEPLTTFTNLATNLVFPDGYEVMFVYNLAKYLAPKYGMSISPEAMDIAVNSMALVKGRNLPAPVMKTEVGMITNDYAFGYWNA